ncbi:MAG: hypothetical protein II721_03000 [Bacilli bacterium]|nr:hypothetical protein [Bacilli bacterium]
MGTSEIVIAVLLGLLLCVVLIYFVYFSNNAYKKRVKRLESEEMDEVPYRSKKGLTIGLAIYFLISSGMFAFRLVNATVPLYGEEYWASVNSSSMATINSSNTYILDNKLNDRIFAYDLVAFKKEYGELKQYDIVLFKKNNLYVAHRIIDDPSSGSFHTQGDANPLPDEWIVNTNEVMGVYTHKIPFLSFLNYLSYTPGFYIAWGASTIGIGIAIYFEIKNNSLKNSISDKNSLD